MLDVVSQWVAQYGYVLIVVFLFIEGAGVPVPGETVLAQKTVSAAAVARAVAASASRWQRP